MAFTKLKPTGIDLSQTFAFTGTVSGAGGITAATTYRITSNFANNANPITSNWEEADTDGYGRLGTAVSQSSGIFTLPSTGVWLILLNFAFDEGGGGDDTSMHAYIRTTTDNSSYSEAAVAYDSFEAANNYLTVVCSFLFNCSSSLDVILICFE